MYKHKDESEELEKSEKSENSENSEKSEEETSMEKLLFGQDNFLAFKKIFMSNIKSISRKTMIHTMGEVDNELLNANICWLVADAMIDILVVGEEIDNFNGNISQDTCGAKYRKVDVLKLFLRTNLDSNNILRIFTVSCNKRETLGDDHWFVAIGSEAYVYLIEWGKKDETNCHIWEKMTQNKFIEYMMNMMIGEVKDRFYGSKKPHTVKIWAFERRPLSVKTITNYLTS